MTGINRPPLPAHPAPAQSPAIVRCRRAARWLWLSALLALAPKCTLCVLAYAGFGTALGLGGPELCGAPAGSSFTWTSALAWLGLSTALGAMILRTGNHHRNPPPVPRLRTD